MRKGVIEEQHNVDKQMGCMANFLHIFDRHHSLTGKRLPPTITHSPSQPPTPVSSRLSLDDNRTITNCPDNSEIASDKQRPSISVVAKLMGLDEPITDSEANRDHSLPLLHHHYRFFDTNNNFRLKIKPSNASDPKQKTETNFRPKKKSCFYDSDDLFPEKTKKTSVTVGDEIEKKLKRRGIDEPYDDDDIHALKQILEALQLKGLLHSNNYKSTLQINQTPIVVMKPNKTRPHVSNSPQRSSSFGSSPRRVRAEPEAIRTQLQEKGRNLRQPARCVRRCPDRMRNVAVAPVNSPKVNMRINVPEQQVTSRSKRGVAEEDESTTVSDTSLTTINLERRYKKEEYREGRNVLERCDKLLNSIAEMKTIELQQQQPSPVSVFHSSFYKHDSPSPLIKHYKGDSEDEALCYNGVVECEDSDDFVYVSEILRACSYFPHDTNVFMLLEKQQFLKGNDTSKTCMLERRLIFDTIQEILNKNKRLPPWKEVSMKMDKIWLEFKRMREREGEEETCSDELLDVICLILRKDMAQEIMNQCPVEMGDLILDIERLVFKDLIGEIIRDLASFKEPLSMFRRKLMF